MIFLEKAITLAAVAFLGVVIGALATQIANDETYGEKVRGLEKERDDLKNVVRHLRKEEA